MRDVARLVVCTILVFAPWAFGTTERWSLWTVQALTAVAFALALISLWKEPRQSPRELIWQWRWGGPMLGLALYIAVQALNASHQYQAANQSLIPQSHIRWLPHSVDAAATWEALGVYLTYAAIFWTVRISFADTSQWRFLFNTLVISGFLMALIGILQYLSGTRYIFWLRGPITKNQFFGPFVNPNNYAAYMNLLIPMALALGRERQQHAETRRRGSHPGYLYFYAAALMAVSVFLAKSRAGIIICVGVIAGWLVLELVRQRRDRFSGLKALLTSVALLVTVLIGLLYFAGFAPVERKLATLQNVSVEWSAPVYRGAAYRAMWAMFEDNWLCGVGAGAFSSIFPYYQPASLPGFWRYAHSDWLQWTVELGVVGGLIALALGVGVLIAIRAASQMASSRLTGAIGIGLVGLFLHATVDFPFHIVGVVSLAASFLACISACGGEHAS